MTITEGKVSLYAVQQWNMSSEGRNWNEETTNDYMDTTQQLKDHISFGEWRLRLGIQDAKLMLRKDVQQGILATDETYIVIRFICNE